ncbi:MAG: hypothetical protein CEN88_459 [Candidatus Berkelbacteria bacterium Licking1014_2]|uniref:Uncharacterized protein n=1 Tax=Candidatus Berkelbacteria bacterium Licking1014_2 TaxID=2017146 RepID=A0A554LRQ2_9BACT|nr:MAG: hypothetical protein CEN88_459 [Candidatus Berkelbacteria bacterium Licking1014_2]
MVKANTTHPIILKLSVAHWRELAGILLGVNDLVEAISINSVPWNFAFPKTRSPLAHLGGGGISGQAVQPFTETFLRAMKAVNYHHLRKNPMPVIVPNIWEEGDIRWARRLGDALSFGSIFLRYPWRPRRIIASLSAR